MNLQICFWHIYVLKLSAIEYETIQKKNVYILSYMNYVQHEEM